ncbi:monovalent cation/H+ antiporter subunit D family protein [Magnetococcales bacterium HHB-1]
MNSISPLFWTIFIPCLGALGIYLANNDENKRELVTLSSAVLLFFTVISLVPGVMDGKRETFLLFHMTADLPVFLKIEPLGMTFALIASSLWIINSIYSIGYMRGNNEKHQTRFYICFAISIASVMGIAFAGNLLTLFIFYEAITLATYPLVTHSGTDKAKKAGRTYLGILLFTSVAFQLLAILWTHLVAGTGDFQPGGILAGKADGPLASILLFLFMYGIGKAALMPFHRWLPAAMVAPTPVSALLHAVAVVKAGVFSVVKIIVYIFGIDFLVSSVMTSWLLYISGATIIIASIIALKQDNLKRRLAYSTVSQLSYVTMAAAILSPISVKGAALHIVAHAFGKITLFFAAGSIYTAAHKTEISQLNGIGKRMPWTMAAFAIGALSMIGLPPTAGFISKWYILMGAMDAQSIFAIAVIFTSTLLNAAYFLPIIYVAFFKKESAETAEHPHGEAPLPIVIALTATAAGTLLIFLFPDLPLALAHQLVGVSP